MADEQQIKRCNKCGKEYPATTEFFTKCSEAKDGLHWKCKECKHVDDYKGNSKRREWAKEYMRDKRKNNLEYRERTNRESVSRRAAYKQISLYAHDKITQDILKEAISYDPITGVFSNKSLEYYSDNINGVWGYRYINIDNIQYRACRLAWFYVHGWWPAVIDHINGDRLDDSICNLRGVNQRENALNTYKHRNGRMPGAYNRCHKWLSSIKLDTGVLRLGSFDTEREASLAYCRYCLKHGLARREFMPPEFTDEELGILK